LKIEKNEFMRSSQHLPLLIIILFFLSACGSLTAPKPGPGIPVEPSESQVLLAEFKDINSTLKHFKGIGKIKLQQKGQIRIDERIAWVGSAPSKLSLAVFISGFPAIKLASDGQWLYYYESGREKNVFKKIRTNDPSLKRLIYIPIKTSEIVTLIAGRIPLRDYHSSRLVMLPDSSGHVLELKNRWWGVLEKLYLDAAKTRIRQIEFFNRRGALEYRVTFEKMKTISGYRVPVLLNISNDEGIDVQFKVDRFWANIEILPSMFVLEPPG